MKKKSIFISTTFEVWVVFMSKDIFKKEVMWWDSAYEKTAKGRLITVGGYLSAVKNCVLGGVKRLTKDGTEYTANIDATIRKVRKLDKYAVTLTEKEVSDGFFETVKEVGRDYKKMKNKLPVCSFGRVDGGVRRTANPLPSGFVYIDVDAVPGKPFDVEEAKKALLEVPGFVATWRSVGGQGVSALVYVEGLSEVTGLHKGFSAKSWYAHVYNYIAKECDNIGYTTDSACKDITRITFVSHDENLLLHPTNTIRLVDLPDPAMSKAGNMKVDTEFQLGEIKYSSEIAFTYTGEYGDMTVHAVPTDIGDFNPIDIDIMDLYFNQTLCYHNGGNKTGNEFSFRFGSKCVGAGIAYGTVMQYLFWRLPENFDAPRIHKLYEEGVGFGTYRDVAIRQARNGYIESRSLASFTQADLAALRSSSNDMFGKNAGLYDGIGNISSDVDALMVDAVYRTKFDYLIPEGKKLSDIFTADMVLGKCMIEVPTGAGKTFFMSSIARNTEHSVLLSVPTQGLLEEVVQKYGAVPYYEKSKDANPNKDKFIVVCHQGLSNFINAWGGEILNGNKFIVAIDEAHNIVSNRLLNKTFTRVIRELKKNKIENILLATGTTLKNEHEYFKDFRSIRVGEERPRTALKFQFAVCEDMAYGLVKETRIGLDEGSQVAIAIRSKGAKLDTIIANLLTAIPTLRKKDIALINADQKTTDVFKNVVVEGDISKYKVLIVTDILKEGTSITTSTKRVKVLTTEHIFHVSDFRQYATRYRSADEVEFTLIKKANSKASKAIVDLDEYVRNIREKGERFVNLLNAQIALIEAEENAAIAIDICNEIEKMRSAFKVDLGCVEFDSFNRRYFISELKIGSLRHLQEAINQNRDVNTMREGLTQLGFEVNNTTKVIAVDSKRDKKAIKKMRDELVDARVTYFNKVLDRILKEGVLINHMIAERGVYPEDESGTKRRVPIRELTIRKRVDAIRPFFPSINGMVNFVREHGYGNKSWDRVMQNKTFFHMLYKRKRSWKTETDMHLFTALKNFRDDIKHVYAEKLMLKEDVIEIAKRHFNRPETGLMLDDKTLYEYALATIEWKIYERTIHGVRGAALRVLNMRAYPDINFSKTYAHSCNL